MGEGWVINGYCEVPINANGVGTFDAFATKRINPEGPKGSGQRSQKLIGTRTFPDSTKATALFTDQLETEC